MFYNRDSVSVGIWNLARCKLISHPIFLPCFSKSGFCTLVYAHSTKPCLKNNSNRSPCTSKLNILMCQPKDDQVGQFDCLLDHLILFHSYSSCEIQSVWNMINAFVVIYMCRFVILFWKLNKVMQGTFNPNSDVLYPLLNLPPINSVHIWWTLFNTLDEVKLVNLKMLEE